MCMCVGVINGIQHDGKYDIFVVVKFVTIFVLKTKRIHKIFENRFELSLRVQYPIINYFRIV